MHLIQFFVDALYCQLKCKDSVLFVKVGTQSDKKISIASPVGIYNCLSVKIQGNAFC